MQKQVIKENSSGIVRLQGDKFFWNYKNKNILQIDISDIVVIGEYINAEGPYIDDWFLTFITKDGHWQSIPWYADNIDELTQYLSNKFHQNLNEPCLANSTEWKSIIRYPTHLIGKTLFTLIPCSTYKEPKTFLDKILSSVGLGNFDITQTITLAEEIKEELNNTSL